MKRKCRRVRRVLKMRSKLQKCGYMRLCVYKSNKNFYLQLFSSDGKNVLVQASSVEKVFNRNDITKGKSGKEIAESVGRLFAYKCKQLNIDRCVFDRAGYKFHGKIKSAVEEIRKNNILL